MAAPTYGWNTVNTTQTDADSPLDTTLMEAIRQNLVHIEEWLGDGYTAAKNHDHDGTNSKVTVLDISVGDYLTHTNSTERSTASTTYTKAKESLLRGKGTLRITFELKRTGLGAAYGRVYRNGAAVGTERSNTSGTYVEYSEDISGWSDGDLVQVYFKAQSGSNTEVQNLKLKGDVAFAAAINETY